MRSELVAAYEDQQVEHMFSFDTRDKQERKKNDLMTSSNSDYLFIREKIDERQTLIYADVIVTKNMKWETRDRL